MKRIFQGVAVMILAVCPSAVANLAVDVDPIVVPNSRIVQKDYRTPCKVKVLNRVDWRCFVVFQVVTSGRAGKKTALKPFVSFVIPIFGVWTGKMGENTTLKNWRIKSSVFGRGGAKSG